MRPRSHDYSRVGTSTGKAGVLDHNRIVITRASDMTSHIDTAPVLIGIERASLPKQRAISSLRKYGPCIDYE